LGMDVKILSGNEEEIEMRESDEDDEVTSDKLNLNLEGAEMGME
jgi:DNA-directed RNA polymerase subunit beta